MVLSASVAPAYLDVLVVENNPAMARLSMEAFREVDWPGDVHCLPDGEQAIAFLQRTGPFATKRPPEIIFLDLDLPRKPGFQFLRELKSNPELKVTPVVILSGHESPAEIREAYELHASCYIRKPHDLHEFLHFLRVCREFWGSVVTLPSNVG